MEKGLSLQHTVGKTIYPYIKKEKLDYLSPYISINSNWIKDSTVRPWYYEITKRKYGEKSPLYWSAIWNNSKKCWQVYLQIKKLLYSFCTAKETILKMKLRFKISFLGSTMWQLKRLHQDELKGLGVQLSAKVLHW